jgi:monoamine oxidase
VTDTQVAIIGGGLSGLYAARLLHQAGVDFVLFEARDRLGGRILTVDANGGPSVDGFDLGPSWFWPQVQPAIGALIADLGLDAFPQASQGDVVFERMSREPPQRYTGSGMDPASMRLVGGTAALVSALRRDLHRDHLRLTSFVRTVSLTKDGVSLNVLLGSDEHLTRTARKVIAALPPRLLEATVQFMPAQASETVRLWRETPTWMAPTAKFAAVYDEPFWRAAGLSGTAQSLVGPLAEIHDASTASGQPALFGFLGVSAAQRAVLDHQALTDACITQLMRIFGPEARTPRATLLKDWTTDPLTATRRDAVATGHPTSHAGPWVVGPWADRLALAGSETSPSEAGYLAGAIVAAERAVAAVLRGL